MMIKAVIFDIDNTLVDFLKLKEILFLDNSIKLPNDDIKKHKTPSQYLTTLENSAVDNLKKWYKKDYEFYEYCRMIYDKRWK